MQMAKKLIIGNWKMNPENFRAAERLARSTAKAVRAAKADVVVCPPHPFLGMKLPKALRLGAQDLSSEKDGAHTGDVSSRMLSSMGVRYVIVGHSERRASGDTQETVNKKMKNTLSAGLVPVLCVGEEVRDDHSHYLHVIREELKSALKGIPKDTLTRVIVAYEPVWAVGRSAAGVLSPEDALQMNIYIRKVFADLAGEIAAKKLKVLYGGSVDAKNAGGFLTEGRMDGLLVGRASLDAKQFGAIVTRANG